MARNNNKARTADIPDTVQVGSTQLPAGTYKVEVRGQGAHAQVTLLKQGKAVASVPATVKTNDPRVTEDDVITDHGAGHPVLLREIDFGHGKEAVILNRSARQG